MSHSYRYRESNEPCSIFAQNGHETRRSGNEWQQQQQDMKKQHNTLTPLQYKSPLLILNFVDEPTLLVFN